MHLLGVCKGGAATCRKAVEDTEARATPRGKLGRGAEELPF